MWKPELPRSPRYVWVLGPVGWPQASSFWRRELFERHGLFREDMHYVFDTEFGVRVALAGHLPVLVDGELAVRVLHEDAKSWDRTPWEREERQLVRLHRPALTARERVGLLALQGQKWVSVRRRHLKRLRHA